MYLPKSKLEQAYDRANFLDERVQMMQDWADYLDKIADRPLPQVADSSSANIISFKVRNA